MFDKVCVTECICPLRWCSYRIFNYRYILKTHSPTLAVVITSSLIAASWEQEPCVAAASPAAGNNQWKSLKLNKEKRPRPRHVGRLCSRSLQHVFIIVAERQQQRRMSGDDVYVSSYASRYMSCSATPAINFKYGTIRYDAIWYSS